MPLRVKDEAEVQIGHVFSTGAATDSGEEAVWRGDDGWVLVRSGGTRRA